MNEYRDFAVNIALEAGELLMKNYGKMHQLDWHIRTNFKIEVDRMSDELIRGKIRENFPMHNIYSEEIEGLDNSSEFSWVCDPLDGTIPYTYEISDHFGVSISLVKDRTPVIGVIYAPKRGELYVAEEGKGAFCNDERMNVSQEHDVNKVLMGLDSGKETARFKRAAVAQYYEKLLASDGIAAPISSACASIPLCLVAKGNLHAYVALSLEPWDMAAAVIINREAGARVTNLEGRVWEIRDESIVTANPILHTKLLRLIGC